METKVEALQDNRVKVTVTVDAKEIDARIKKTYKDFAHKYNFPGFRRGKAPRPVIDNAMGAEAVRATVTDETVNETYPLVIDQENLYPVAKPEFEDGGLVEGGKPYVFEFTVAVKPEFELSSYDAVEVELPAEGASDAEVEEQIKQLCEYYHDFEDASAATKIKEGGFAEISIKATDDAGESIDTLASESRLYGLGTGMFPETFDAELIGMKKGQTKQFAIDVPADGSLLMSQLAGKTEKVSFDVEVKVVKNKVEPEVTDEWVKDKLGFESVEDLRTRVSESISEQKAEALPRMKEDACLAKLIDRLADEVPQDMAEDAETNLLQTFFQQLQRQGVTFDQFLMQQNLTTDQFKEDVKKQALDTAKQDLALDAWARHYGLTATDEDVTAEFARSGAEDPKALEEEWRNNGQLYLIRQGLARQKAMDDVMEKAQVAEVDFAAKAAEEEGKKKPAKKATKKKAEKAEAAADADAPAEKPAKKPAKKKAAKAEDAADASAAE